MKYFQLCFSSYPLYFIRIEQAKARSKLRQNEHLPTLLNIEWVLKMGAWSLTVFWLAVQQVRSTEAALNCSAIPCV